jgi:hypothetical protein
MHNIIVALSVNCQLVGTRSVAQHPPQLIEAETRNRNAINSSQVVSSRNTRLGARQGQNGDIEVTGTRLNWEMLCPSSHPGAQLFLNVTRAIRK